MYLSMEERFIAKGMGGQFIVAGIPDMEDLWRRGRQLYMSMVDKWGTLEHQ